MSDIAIAAGFVVVALLRFWCGYRWARGRELHLLYGQRHVPSRNPPLLNAATGVLSIIAGVRLYAAMHIFVGPLAGVLALLIAFVAFVLFGFAGQLGIHAWHGFSLRASEEEKSALLGFSSVEEMRRFNAAALGYASAEEMYEQQEAAYSRLAELAQKGQEAPAPAANTTSPEVQEAAFAPETYKSTQGIKSFHVVAKGMRPYSTTRAVPEGMHTYTYDVEGMPPSDVYAAMTAYSDYLTTQMGYTRVSDPSVENVVGFAKTGKKLLLAFAPPGSEDQLLVVLDD